jgi:DNA repair exonuclease SbcCD ATPase subunit
MTLKFGKLKIRNFQSFGNDETEIDFNTNLLTLITGQNGAGKSTILEALNFACFGRPYRKIKIGDLVNRYNKKNLETDLEIIRENNIKWRIVRGLAPQKLEIYKDGELQIKQDIKEMQNFIETSILGFDEKIFRQIVTLGSGYYVPFLKLPLAQKREIIEQLFELDVFSKMKVVTKDKISKQETKLYNIENEKRLILNTISNLKAEHERALKHNEQIKIQKENEKEKIKISIKEKEEEKNNLECNINDLSEKIETLGGDNVRKEIEEIKNKIIQLSLNHKGLKSTIEDKYKPQLTDIQNIIVEGEKKLRIIESEELKTNFNIQQEKRNELDLHNKQINQIDIEVRLLEKEIFSIRKELKFYEENTACPTCGTDLTGERIIDLVEELKSKESISYNILEHKVAKIDSIKLNEKNIIQKYTAILYELNEKNKNEKIILEEQLQQYNDEKNKINDEIDNEIKNQSQNIRNEMDKLDGEKRELETDLTIIQTQERNLQDQRTNLKLCNNGIENFKKQLENIDNNFKYIDIDEIFEKLEESRNKITETNKSEKKEKLILSYFEKISELVSDSGIKTQIIKNYLPIIETKVKEYLALFSSEYSIEFSEEFDTTIKLRMNEKIDYDSLSGGEKIRVDLAIMFSFVSFIKMKTGAMTNLIFFDEILDSSLDTQGISSLVQILNLFTQNEFTIFVISHREENKSEDFKKVFEVKKERYSKIIEV